MHLAGGRSDHAAFFRARQHGKPAPIARRLQRRFETFHLEQSFGLFLIGEQDVDVGLHQLQEFRAIASDAERIGERERDPPSGALRRGDGFADGGLGARIVPHIAFDIEHGSRRDFSPARRRQASVRGRRRDRCSCCDVRPASPQ